MQLGYTSQSAPPQTPLVVNDISATRLQRRVGRRHVAFEKEGLGVSTGKSGYGEVSWGSFSPPRSRFAKRKPGKDNT